MTSLRVDHQVWHIVARSDHDDRQPDKGGLDE
jgi:hypothetical protein